MKFLLAITVILYTTAVNAQIPRPVLYEMNRFDVNTVLLYQSRTITYRPVWTADSKALLFYMDKRWVKLDLTQVILQPAEWNHRFIGLNSTEVLDSVFDYELNRTTIQKEPGASRKITTSKGVTYELKVTPDFTTRFVKTKGRRTVTLWETGGDNCLAPVLSPDEKFIAFISESNGLMLYALHKKDYQTRIPEAAKLINKALEIFVKKNSPKVEHLLNHAYRKDTTSAEAIAWKAYLKLYVGEKEDALRLMNRAVICNPKNSSYFFFRGQILKSLNDTENAISCFEYYTGLRPFDYHGYYELGLLYESQKDPEKACYNYELAEHYHLPKARMKSAKFCSE